MASARTAFTIRYDLEPGDLRAGLDWDRRRRRRRIGCLVLLVLMAYIVALVAAFIAGFHLQARADGTGVPGWFYLVDAVGVALLVLDLWLARRVWRLSPAWLTRHAWRSRPDLHGRHQHEIGADGVTSIAPDGSRTFLPWAAVAAIRETGHVFCLVPAGPGQATVLPKRGLPDPCLLPDLRAFLHGSADRSKP